MSKNPVSSYNHGASNKGCGMEKGYAKPKPLGNGMPKPSPDMKTQEIGKGSANSGHGKK